jgi:hypothetical protein
MIDEYGSLTNDDILQHVLTYNGMNVRHAQNLIFRSSTASQKPSQRLGKHVFSWRLAGTPSMGAPTACYS